MQAQAYEKEATYIEITVYEITEGLCFEGVAAYFVVNLNKYLGATFQIAEELFGQIAYTRIATFCSKFETVSYTHLRFGSRGVSRPGRVVFASLQFRKGSF